MIAKETIDRVTNEADIVEVITDFIRLVKRGRNYIGLCPFHKEKTPSFNVSSEKQIYKCFGCGKAGSAISFVMDIAGLSYPEAIKYLANKFNITVVEEQKDDIKSTKNDLILACLDKATDIFSKNLKDRNYQNAQQYLIKRGFNYEIQQKFHLGYAPDSWDKLLNELKWEGFSQEIIIDSGLAVNPNNNKIYDRYRNRIIFPIKNFAGKIIGFGGRDISTSPDKNSAKYINSPQTAVYDKSKVLYGLYDAKGTIRLKDSAILVEGYADVITMHNEGYQNTIASCGTAITAEQLHLLKRYTNNLIILYDSDLAGQNATVKAIGIALKEGFSVRIIELGGGEDPDSFLRSQGKMQFKNRLDNALDFLTYLIIRNKKTNESSPQNLSRFIKGIVKLVSCIPDKLQHDFYLESLSEQLRLSVNQRNEINTLYDKLTIKQTKDKAEVKSTYSPDNHRNSKLEIVKTKDSEPETVKLIKSLKSEEILIFKAILEDKKFYDFILEDKKFSAESFLSEDAQIVFDAIIHTKVENNTKPLTSIINSELTSEKTKAIISEIVLSEIFASDSWKNFSNIDLEQNWDKIIKDAVSKIELENKLKEQQHLKEKIFSSIQPEEKIQLILKLQQLNLDISDLNPPEN